MANSLAVRQPGGGPRPWLARLLERMRHGLLEQEILDRLARLGIVCYPYFVSVESARPRGASPSADGYELRVLAPADAAEISRITLLKTRSTTPQALAARMAHALCLGAFADGALVGYTWVGFDGLPTPGSGRQWLFRLEPDEACLFDLYVVPAHRGQRLAALLRHRVTDILERRGCRRAYSVSLAFNRATRRFKARIGAREAELRLYLHLRWRRLPGIDLRLRRFGFPIAAPRAKLVAPLGR
jgi:GNAT superfamily N-acetyltransferase